MSTYRLTISFDIKAFDDLDARRQANELVSQVSALKPSGRVVLSHSKLQELYKNRPPRGIELSSTECAPM